MATISGFKAQMAQGGARPNQFRVELTFPALVLGTTGGPAVANAAQFLCKAAALPASTLEDITTLYRGRPVHFAGERTFAPWTVSIYNEANFAIRDAMETWHNFIVQYSATNGSVAPTTYQVDMSVFQLDRNDRVIKEYRFYDAYPTSVGQIGLDFDANNQIELFDVEFTYNYFTASNVV